LLSFGPCDVNRINMPIRLFLSDQAFDSETSGEMSLALSSVCEELGLTVRDDPATRLVAEKIIELKKHGVHGVATLRAMTLQKFQPQR
jgi:hypothetical protein